MLKADFHVHTVLSRHNFLSKLRLIDGLNTPREMVRAAAQKGLDVIAITDHNVLFLPKLAKQYSKEFGIVVVPGSELSFNGKDIVILGVEYLPDVQTLSELREDVNSQDGILIAPHPNDPLGRGSTQFEYFDGIEVINGFSIHASDYDKLLEEADKLKKAKVCGSDAHCVDQLGFVQFLIEAEPDVDSIISAVKKRKTIPIKASIPGFIQAKYYLKKYLLAEAMRKPALKRLFL